MGEDPLSSFRFLLILLSRITFITANATFVSYTYLGAQTVIQIFLQRTSGDYFGSLGSDKRQIRWFRRI